MYQFHIVRGFNSKRADSLVLANKLITQFPHSSYKLWSWRYKNEFIYAINNSPNGKIALIGHSWGAVMLTKAVHSINRNIDVLITLDIILADVKNLPNNVSQALNIYSPGVIRSSKNFGALDIPVNKCGDFKWLDHQQIDDDPGVHRDIVLYIWVYDYLSYFD